jgi:hypothetical protein
MFRVLSHAAWIEESTRKGLSGISEAGGKEGFLTTRSQPSLFTTPVHDSGCKRPIRLPKETRVYATFGGPNDCYRYKLEHCWRMGDSRALFAMMNPSAADLEFTDATVAKCGRLAKRWGYDGLFAGNACAYRATDRMRLLEVEDPVGPGNHQALREMAESSDLVIVAHGKLPGDLQKYATQMVEVLRATGKPLHILGLSSDGTPIHPLARGKAHVPEDIRPRIWFG